MKKILFALLLAALLLTMLPPDRPGGGAGSGGGWGVDRERGGTGQRLGHPGGRRDLVRLLR